MNDFEKLEQLPFITRRKNGSLNFWNPVRPDDPAKAYLFGVAYAVELRRAAVDPWYVALVFSGIAKARRNSHVEFGFYHGMAQNLSGPRLRVVGEAA